MEDQNNKRGLGLAIAAVYEYNIVDFENEGEFKQSIKSGIEQMLRPDISKKNVKLIVDFYGLTGAGF